MKMSEEQAKEIRNSLIWEQVVGEIDYRIECATQRLRTCKEDELRNIQKAIQLWEEFKFLPDDCVSREE